MLRWACVEAVEQCTYQNRPLASFRPLIVTAIFFFHACCSDDTHIDLWILVEGSFINTQFPTLSDCCITACCAAFQVEKERDWEKENTLLCVVVRKIVSALRHLDAR